MPCGGRPAGRVSGQGLPPAPDRHPVRSGHAPAAPLPLRRLRRDGGGWPAHCRSTPELDQVRAQFSAGVLEYLLPIDAGIDPETLRACTLKVGAALVDTAATDPAVAASAITLTLDSTFIRSCEKDQRHLEVRLGNVEASSGARQVFAAVAKTDTSIAALIQRSLAEVGQAQETKITAFTDGCSGLRSILVDAGVTAPPYLDWFHIAMRLHHAEKTAGTLPIDTPEQEHARAVIVTEIDRLHWRIWNGKAKDAQITLERIRKLMPAFHGDGGRKKDPAWRRLWKALREIDRYLSSQGTWLVNYAERHRAGLRVGTSLTEATANFLVNRRMNKSQHMRWSRRGADLLLQCAVLNGKFGSGFGQLFKASPGSEMAMAACPPFRCHSRLGAGGGYRAPQGVGALAPGLRLGQQGRGHPVAR